VNFRKQLNFELVKNNIALMSNLIQINSSCEVIQIVKQMNYILDFLTEDKAIEKELGE
jgi:hypothetical protein